MPWFLRPAVVDEIEAQTIMDEMRADGIDLTRDQARELARAKLGPPKTWIDHEPEPLSADAIEAIHRVRDEHTLPLVVRDHRGHRHAANETCNEPDPAPAPGRGTADHRQSHADQRQPAPEAHVESTPNVARPEQAAGLGQGQTRRATRKQNRQNRRFRSVSYIAPNDDDDEWTPM